MHLRKNNRLNLLFRLLITCALGTICMYYLFVSENYLRSVYFIVFWVLALLECIWYTERTNRDFTSLILALLQNDFTINFNEKTKGKTINKLYKTFNLITRKFHNISSQKEVQHLFLEMLIQHIKVGILSFDKHEKIHLINDTFKSLINKPDIISLKGIEMVNKDLANTLRTIKSGESKLVNNIQANRLQKLSLSASEFILNGAYYKLISVQDIRNELEEQEALSWQKLIRVLTHEIMNSVTPITSLTGTLHQIVQQMNQSSKYDKKTIENLLNGLDAIHNRGEGLLSFTNAYRGLTRIPEPHLKIIEVGDVIHQTTTLLNKELEKRAISLHVEGNTTEKITVDPEQIVQVLINLIKNAMDALEEKSDLRAIRIETKKLPTERIQVTITDNGTGISPDLADKIFIPFFTTKKSGSGIGLPLCRQILHKHTGTLQVESVKGQGTRVVIIL